MDEYPLMVGLGELLWDLLPSGKVLGGAPANFVYMAAILGNRGAVVSRVGSDNLGREAFQTMRKVGLNTDYVQCDDKYETGTAEISFDLEGQHHFSIKTPAAWDYLEWTPALHQLAEQTAVVCFGSLAQRSPVSASSIERFLENLPGTALCICDANLRDPYFSTCTLERSFRYADIVKVNSDELLQIAKLLKFDNDIEDAVARRLLEAYDLKLVCVTRGNQGSLIISTDQTIVHEGFPVKVADTVGAGDAFTACLAHYYVRGKDLSEISERSNRFGAWVASQTGATPVVDSAQLQAILDGNMQGGPMTGIDNGRLVKSGRS
jgi:fructokinase